MHTGELFVCLQKGKHTCNALCFLLFWWPENRQIVSMFVLFSCVFICVPVLEQHAAASLYYFSNKAALLLLCCTVVSGDKWQTLSL